MHAKILISSARRHRRAEEIKRVFVLPIPHAPAGGFAPLHPHQELPLQTQFRIMDV
jgi:hypothetical protein